MSLRRFGGNRSVLIAAVGITSLALSSAAQAARVDLVSFSGPGGGLDISINVEDNGSDWSFAFANNSGDGSSLTEVWFEVGFRSWSLIAGGPGNRSASNRPGLSFSPRAGSLPNGGIAGWNGNGFSFGSDSVNNGVNSTAEVLVINATKANSNLGLADMLAALATGGTRIAGYVQNIGGTGASSLVTLTGQAPQGTDPIGQEPQLPSAPTPAAIGPGLALLAGLTLRRRRDA